MKKAFFLLGVSLGLSSGIIAQGQSTDDVDFIQRQSALKSQAIEQYETDQRHFSKAMQALRQEVYEQDETLSSLQRQLLTVQQNSDYKASCQQATTAHQKHLAQKKAAYEERIEQSHQAKARGQFYTIYDGRFYYEDWMTCLHADPLAAVNCQFGVTAIFQQMSDRTKILDTLFAERAKPLRLDFAQKEKAFFDKTIGLELW